MIDRVHGRAPGRETAIGWMPSYDDIDWKELDYPREKFDYLQAFDRKAWHAEVMEHEKWLMGLRDHLPPEIIYERELLICRLQDPIQLPTGGNGGPWPSSES